MKHTTICICVVKLFNPDFALQESNLKFTQTKLNFKYLVSLMVNILFQPRKLKTLVN